MDNMARFRTYNRRNILIIVIVIILSTMLLTGRLVYLMIFKSEDYGARARVLHEREATNQGEARQYI